MKRVYVYSHTHWDREWSLSQRQFQFMLGKTLDEVLETLELDENFICFMADGQTCVIEDYLEIRPKAAKRVEDLIRSGRLIIGPWYTMPDLWLSAGESLIRNLLQGLLDCEAYGVQQPKLGYVPDSFGHIEQMPQILNGFNIDNYLFWRGEPFEGRGEFLEFIWVGADNKSKLRAHWLPGGYCNAAMLEGESNQKGLRRQLQYLLQPYFEKSARPDLALLCNGIDHIWIQKDLPLILKKARQFFPDCEFILGSVLDYMRAFEESAQSLPERCGCLRGKHLHSEMLHGTWSSRIDNKIANAHAEAALINLAEPMSAIIGLFGGPVRADELRLAWRLLLQNHAHDSICGCSIDRVHADVNRRFTHVLEISQMVAAEALEFLNGRAIRENQPHLILYAGLNGASGCVEFLLDQKVPGPFHLRDSKGKSFPVQVISTRRLVRTNGTQVEGVFQPVDKVQLEFTEVRAVAMLALFPPCGIEVYGIVEGEYADVDDPVKVSAHSLENKFLKVRVNNNGTLNVLHKPTGREFAGLLELTDEADLGGGYAFIPLSGDVALNSNTCRATVEVIERGPLRWGLSLSYEWSLPAGLDVYRKSRSDSQVIEKINTQIFLETNSETLFCHMRLTNTAKDHRIQINMPTDIITSVVHTERAFVVTDEDTSRYTADVGQDSHPMRNWVSVSDDFGGIAFVGKGLHEFSLSRYEGGSVLRVTLLRAVPFILFCAPRQTPEAQLLGEQDYEYALIFHSGNWRSARVAQRASRFVYPAVAQVHGQIGATWEVYPYNTSKMVELHDEGEIPIDSHRSLWQSMVGDWVGWRRREESRLPQVETPERVFPINLDSDEVLVSAFKRAERDPKGGHDERLDIILRIYSVAAKVCKCGIGFGFPVDRVWISNLAEDCSSSLNLDGRGHYTLDLSPFEVKTLRIRPCQTKA